MIVLTRDRPATLERCTSEIVSHLGPDDRLTVLDDSCGTDAIDNSRLLAVSAARSSASMTHVVVSQAREAMRRSLDPDQLLWMAKTAPRDIAPLRNLSLLLSTAVPADTTLLIDDDICDFDLQAVHERVTALARRDCGVIVGARIAGINERDTIERLTDALDGLVGLGDELGPRCWHDLFWVKRSIDCATRTTRYVSGGFLAFQIPFGELYAFPPGYNEDWLWCLLYSTTQKVSIWISGAVTHGPPDIRRPTRSDVLFELNGDLIFDCLEEQQPFKATDPVSVICSMAGRVLDEDSLPAVRTAKLLERASLLSGGGPCPAALELFGLGILRCMLAEGHLNLDAGRVVREWCYDAVAKHKAMAATLYDYRSVHVLESLLLDGRLSYGDKA